MTPQDKELMKAIALKHATTIPIDGKLPDKKQVESALNEGFFEFVYSSMEDWGNLMEAKHKGAE